MEYTINCKSTPEPFEHFWRSTGFTPANLLFDADMQQALAYAGAVAHDGITYVRIHYLLELVVAEGLGTGTPHYDWTRLDAALDVLVRNGLKPFFELMGNVSGFFDDYTDATQAHAWKRLVRDLAQHLIDRYDQDVVRTWIFETWNEPDIGFWKQSIEAFCIYYDACVEGLREADPELIIGGPGTCRDLSEMLVAFLAHCDTGTNYFTGETGVRLDFISVHVKGVRAHQEDLNPNSIQIIEREAHIIDYIREHHPRFAGLPFINDECDPQVGWGDIHTWRARPYYAAFVAKVINQHLIALADAKEANYGLLSNDNGFLGTWGHRTLLARFAEFEHIDHGQADGKRDAPRREEDVRRRKFELIKKPVFTVMTLLSLLGDERWAVGLGHSRRSVGRAVTSDVGIIATRRADDQIAILVYNSRDTIMASGITPVMVRLENVPFTAAMLVHYRIDTTHSDPFTVWERMGALKYPTPEQFAALREAQEIALLEAPREVNIVDGKLSIAIDLPLPGVSLLLLATKPAYPPDVVTGLRAERYAGLMGQEEVLLIWDGLDSRSLRTYEVLRAGAPDGPFVRINGPDQIDAAYLHVAERVAGYYKVRAVDYWGRAGEASDTIEV